MTSQMSTIKILGHKLDNYFCDGDSWDSYHGYNRRSIIITSVVERIFFSANSSRSINNLRNKIL